MWKKLAVLLLVAVAILSALLVWRLAGQTKVTNLPLAIGFGFLAGIILNVMPCVLPVVGLKVHGLIQQAGQAPGRVRLLGLAFAAGILCVFLILAAFAAFAGLGWGRAFQSDRFLVAMIALLVVFAMGMFEVYTIRLPAFVSKLENTTHQQEGVAGSFGKGMLATVLATPCSAPLLGATLTYALRQPPPITFTVFAAVGFGMAFPYVLLSWNPSWLTLLPHSGPWMRTFKEFMGFLILGTAVWLLWQRRFDGDLVVWTVAFCLLVALAAWLYGRWSSPQATAAKQALAPFVSVLIIASGAYFCFGLMYDPNNERSVASSNTPPIPSRDTLQQEPPEWQPFSLAKLDQYLEQGSSVMVMWSADW